MIALGPLLIFLAIGFFAWLLFTLAVFAVPVFAGVTIGLRAFHTGLALWAESRLRSRLAP